MKIGLVTLLSSLLISLSAMAQAESHGIDKWAGQANPNHEKIRANYTAYREIDRTQADPNRRYQKISNPSHDEKTCIQIQAKRLRSWSKEPKLNKIISRHKEIRIILMMNPPADGFNYEEDKRFCSVPDMITLPIALGKSVIGSGAEEQACYRVASFESARFQGSARCEELSKKSPARSAGDDRGKSAPAAIPAK